MGKEVAGGFRIVKRQALSPQMQCRYWQIRLLDHTLLPDAADPGARPGMKTVISREAVSGTLLLNKALPRSAVMEFRAKDTPAEVTPGGLQPDLTRPNHGLLKKG